MKARRYDKFQLANRHRIAFQTLGVTLLMIMINGYVKFFYAVWAEPLLEALVMIYIPVIYFTLMTIVKNAYLSRRDQPVFFIVGMGIATILFGATAISNIMSGSFIFMENGQLTNQVGSLLMLFFAASTTIALVFRRIINKRMLEEQALQSIGLDHKLRS